MSLKPKRTLESNFSEYARNLSNKIADGVEIAITQFATNVYKDGFSLERWTEVMWNVNPKQSFAESLLSSPKHYHLRVSMPSTPHASEYKETQGYFLVVSVDKIFTSSCIPSQDEIQKLLRELTINTGLPARLG